MQQGLHREGYPHQEGVLCGHPHLRGALQGGSVAGTKNIQPRQVVLLQSGSL